MAFIEGFKKFMGISPLDDIMDDEDDEQEDNMGLEDVPTRGFSYGNPESTKLDALGSVDHYSDSTVAYQPTQQMSAYSREETTKVVNIHSSAPQSQVVLVKPEKFEEASSIADHLIDKRTVIVNTEAVSPDIRRRLIDFLSGVAYSESGTIKMASNTTFVITPNTVGIMGAQVEDDTEIHDPDGGYQY